MAKLNKMYYYTRSGEKKVNCYYIAIPKDIISDTEIKDTDNLNIIADKNKIIIEKSVDNK